MRQLYDGLDVRSIHELSGLTSESTALLHEEFLITLAKYLWNQIGFRTTLYDSFDGRIFGTGGLRNSKFSPVPLGNNRAVCEIPSRLETSQRISHESSARETGL